MVMGTALIEAKMDLRVASWTSVKVPPVREREGARTSRM